MNRSNIVWLNRVHAVLLTFCPQVSLLEVGLKDVGPADPPFGQQGGQQGGVGVLQHLL